MCVAVAFVVLGMHWAYRAREAREEGDGGREGGI